MPNRIEKMRSGRGPVLSARTPARQPTSSLARKYPVKVDPRHTPVIPTSLARRGKEKENAQTPRVEKNVIKQIAQNDRSPPLIFFTENTNFEIVVNLI